MEGPSGTLTFNGGTNGLYLEEISGFDSPSVRSNVEDIPEGDGATAGDFYYGRRAWTMRGRVVGQTANERNLSVSILQQNLRGLRSDFTLKSAPLGLPAMQMTGRVDQLRVTGGFVKEFQISGISPDPRFYSQQQHIQVATGQASSPGASFPWAFPVDFGGASGATVEVDCPSGGNFETPPLLRISGPISSPLVGNAETGEAIYLDGVTLSSGEYAEIDMGARTVLHSNGTNLYRYLRFPGSVWWQLQPGANTIQLWGGGTTTQTELSVIWRDAWC